MATEAWTLDGVSLQGTNFTIMELNADPPKARAEFVTSADSESGALTRIPLHENRTFTFKLLIAPQASMDAALDQIGALLDKCRRASASPDGVPLVWTPANSTRARTFDVLQGEISELLIGLDGQARAWFIQRPVFTLVLTAKPYWRGTEVTISSASATTPVMSIEVPSVPGDVPALGRLLITDAATQHRRDIEWGVENQFYTSATPSTLILDSDSLTVSGFAGTQTTRTGAYDPNATGNNVIRADVYKFPVAIAGTGDQTHVGTFLVRARVHVNANVLVRFAWQNGDGPMLNNKWGTPAVRDSFADVDLGSITLTTAMQGTQRWTGRIEAALAPEEAMSSTGTIDVDFLMLIPIGEGYGRARGAFAIRPGVITVRDDFTGTTAAASLSGRTAPSGGSWTSGGSATDYVFVDFPGGNEGLKRSTISDSSGSGIGRIATLPTTFTDVAVRSAGYFQTLARTGWSTIARHVDSNNYLQAKWDLKADIGSSEQQTFSLSQLVAGVETIMSQMTFNAASGTWYNLNLVAYASGRCIAYIEANGAVQAILEGFSSDVATGGVLATGKTGFIDYYAGTFPADRYYDQFAAGPPAAEPIVLYSGRAMEFRYDDTVRQSSGGTIYGRVPSYRGTRFLLSPGTSRVVVKPHRNDLAMSAYTPLGDNTTIQVAYTPRGLGVPR